MFHIVHLRQACETRGLRLIFLWPVANNINEQKKNKNLLKMY